MRNAAEWRRLALALMVLVVAVAGHQVARAATPVPATAGTVEKITVHGKSLEGNLSGDSADRTVFVYLPPGYAKEKKRRYPVVYFLHGYTATAEMYVGMLGLPASIDRALAAGSLQPMIFVLPDAMNRYGGSMYSSSPTIGDWEGFVAGDLVDYVDSHYRTIARREARGLAGHSMGGYGTLRIGAKRPDVYSSLYAMSACCLAARGAGPGDAGLEKLTSLAEVEKMVPFARSTLAVSAAWAPNVTAPPFYMDLPTKDGQPRPDVVARYAANAPLAMVSQYVPQLRRYKAIALDMGDKDNIAPDGPAMHEALQKLGVDHKFETYDGDHGNRVASRFGQVVVPYFAGLLVGGKR